MRESQNIEFHKVIFNFNFIFDKSTWMSKHLLKCLKIAKNTKINFNFTFDRPSWTSKHLLKCLKIAKNTKINFNFTFDRPSWTSKRLRFRFRRLQPNCFRWRTQSEWQGSRRSRKFFRWRHQLLLNYSGSRLMWSLLDTLTKW